MSTAQKIQAIVDAVAREKGETYMVGGAVRDSYLNLPTKDVDLLVTGVPYRRLASVLPGKVDLVGQSFGVLKVSLGDDIFDVALPRTEFSTGAGHKDFNVQCDPFLPLEKDLARRDFTMNAIALRLSDNTVIDPFNGVEDIQHKRIRTVGDAAERFVEDPLRMLRGVRFTARLGFHLTARTAIAMKTYSSLIAMVASERIAEEMDRLLMSNNPDAVREALRTLRDTHLLNHIIPEFMDSIGFDQATPYHCYTVDEHVFAAVHHAVKIDANRLARWAVFLHDIAKPATFSQDKSGRGHFYKHEIVGAQTTKAILERLRFSTNDVSSISKMVQEHLRPISPKQGATVSEKALRKYVALMGNLTQASLDMRESDIAAHAGHTFESAREHMRPLREQVAQLSDIQGFKQQKLALDGVSIMELFGVKGKDIGAFKQAAANAVIEGVVSNERNALIAWLQNEFNSIQSASK